MPLCRSDGIFPRHDRVHDLPRLGVVDVKAGFLARATTANFLGCAEEVAPVPGPGQVGDFAGGGVGDGAGADPGGGVPEGDDGVGAADREVVPCRAVGNGGAGGGVRGEGVERNEGWIVEDLDAFALGDEEVGGWVGV